MYIRKIHGICLTLGLIKSLVKFPCRGKAEVEGLRRDEL